MPQLLTVDRSDFMIDLPVSIVLTDTGIQIFSAGGRGVKRIKKENGSVAEGLESSAFNAQTVQKLVMNGYVEEINVHMSELLRSRASIIDTTKLVMYGILYKKMNPSMAERMLKSPVLLAYNRKNSQKPIRSLEDIDKNKAKMLMQTQPDKFEVMSLEIRDLTVQKMLTNQDLQEEDRLLQIRSLDKFISFIDDRIWYLYYIIYQTPLSDEIKEFFAELIAAYLDRTKIATHLATVLMELIQNAEKAHFDKLLLENNLIQSADDSYRFLKNSENRKMVVDLAKSRQQNLILSWQFHSGRAGANLEYKVDIIASNSGGITNNISKQLSQKMTSNTATMNLSDFFKEKDGGGLGAGLGLLYISYLKDDCQKAGVQFTSQIFGDHMNDRTTAKLTVVF